MSVTLNKDSLALMRTFEYMTRCKVVDCFEVDEILYFVVPDIQIGKAIGKGAKNVHLLKKKLNKAIKIIALKPDRVSFIKELISPLVCEITEENGRIVLTASDRKTKGLLIGRNAKNLQNLTAIVKRHFDVEEIIVA